MKTVVILLASALFGLLGVDTANGAEGPPTQRVLGLSSYWSVPDVLPGQPPSLEHPGGTVLVACADVDGGSPRIEEWDMATAGVVRIVGLPLAHSPVTLNMVRAGGNIHVVSEDDQSNIRYVTLTKQLRVEASFNLERGTAPVIATDGNTVAVLWCETSGAAGVDVIDALGEVRGRRVLDGAVTGCLNLDLVGYHETGSPLAVLGGNVYVIASGGPIDAAEFHTTLTRLDSKANVEKQIDMDDEGILWAVRGRLLTEEWDLGGRPCRLVERSLTDLQPVRRHSFTPDALGPGVCPNPDEVGPVAAGAGAATSSSIEAGGQSHVSRGEDIRAVDARLFYRDGKPTLLEFDRRTRAAWLAWMGPASPSALSYVDEGVFRTPILPAHVLALPPTEAAPDVAAGQPPSAEHTRGTVFVVGLESGHTVPAVGEWDLATSVRLRQVDLPLPFKAYRIASTGRRVFVAAVDRLDRIHGIRLTPDLRVEADESFGEGELAAIGADASVVAIAWIPPRSHHASEDDTTFVRVLGPSGATLGTGSRPGSLQSMVVEGSNVYLVVEIVPPAPAGKPEGPAPPSYERLLKLDSSSRTRADVTFSSVHGDRIYPHVGGIMLVDMHDKTAQVRSLADLKPVADLGFPYFPGAVARSEKPGFDLAAGPSGRLLSTRGEVLDAGFNHVERRFLVGPLAAKALWIGEEAAVLDWRSPDVPAHIRWLDP
jgi:hypothetical protein